MIIIYFPKKQSSPKQHPTGSFLTLAYSLTHITSRLLKTGAFSLVTRSPRGRELVVGIVRVHGTELLRRRGAQDFNDLHQLVNAILTGWNEGWLSCREFMKHRLSWFIVRLCS